MNGWRWLGALALTAGLVALAGSKMPVFAGDKEQKLEWKAFDPKGKPFYQTLTTKTEQKMKVMGMDITQNQSQTFYIQWTPGDKSGDNWVVTQKIIGVKMDIDIGGNKISYDSTQPQPNNPMTDFFKALQSIELKFHIDPKDFKIKKIEGREEFVKKLGGTNPQMEPLLKNILSEDALKQMAEPTWAAFPREAVKKGKSWPSKNTLDLGPIGQYNFNNTYTFQGDDKDKKLHKIDVSSELTYSAPSKKEGLPFTIKEGQLSGKSTSGHAMFSEEKGRFESSEMSMQLGGNLTIQIGDMETKVELNQTQSASVRTHDSNPVEELKDKKSK